MERIMWDNCLLGAQLSALSYRNAGPAVTAAKKLGFTHAKLVSNDGAEMLVAKNKNQLWFAFRGTQPSELNDVLADLNMIKSTAMAGGKVHSGFQKEVNDLWMDVVNEIDNNSQLKNPRDCLLYTSPSPRDGLLSRMPSSA